MKKQIQIACLLWAFIAILSGCKKSEVQSGSDVLVKENSKLILGDGKWDLLGYGYDMTGELFASANASDAPIIDVDRFNLDYPNRINTPTESYGYYAVYNGVTAYDYIKDVNKKETFGLTVKAGEPDTNTFGSGNFSKTNEDQHTYTYNGKYSYASFESRVRIKSINFTGDATLDILRNYLTPLFIANLSNYSAEELVKRYGTHVLLGISIGGRLKYDYRGSVVKETTVDRKLRATKAGLSIGVDKIFGISISSDVSKEEKVTIANETTEKSFIGTYYGGTNSGTSFSADALGNTSQNVNLAGWQQSITVNNATLVDINKAVPIYDFITDPVKKEQVKIAVEKYINDRQIVIAKEEVYAYYSTLDQRHAYSLDPQMQKIYPRYLPKETSFRAYSGPHNGAVPVYQFYNSSGNDRVLTTNLNPGWAWYNYDKILFYAYSTQVAGTVPVHEFVHSLGDRYYSTLRNPPGMDGNWKYNGQQFYAFPK